MVSGCLLFVGAYGSWASDKEAKSDLWRVVADEVSVDARLLLAISLAETGHGDGRLWWPRPFVMRSSRGAVEFADEAELRAAIRKVGPRDNVDVGLMQINLHFNGFRVEDVEDLADPFVNLRVGAEIITENLLRFDGDVRRAVATYHSSTARGLRYADRVLGIYKNLEQAGIYQSD